MNIPLSLYTLILFSGVCSYSPWNAVFCAPMVHRSTVVDVYEWSDFNGVLDCNLYLRLVYSECLDRERDIIQRRPRRRLLLS